MRLANALAGNALDSAVFEITLAGPRLRFDARATIALTGAEFPNVASWQPIGVEAGDVLDIGIARHGARAYLAISGGLAVEPTLGSVSTDVNAGIGGRPLREGDRIATHATGARDRERRTLVARSAPVVRRRCRAPDPARARNALRRARCRHRAMRCGRKRFASARIRTVRAFVSMARCSRCRRRSSS